jgi:hypothetical protein
MKQELGVEYYSTKSIALPFPPRNVGHKHVATRVRDRTSRTQEAQMPQRFRRGHHAERHPRRRNPRQRPTSQVKAATSSAKKASRWDEHRVEFAAVEKLVADTAALQQQEDSGPEECFKIGGLASLNYNMLAVTVACSAAPALEGFSSACTSFLRGFSSACTSADERLLPLRGRSLARSAS